jgi:hypothetical protein
MLSKLVHKLFPLSVFAYFISLVVTPSAQAISFTGNLSWQGTGNGTTLTGTFSGNDLDSDGFIRGTATGTNELSLFTVTFTDPSVPASATYNLADLLGFGNYNVSTGFLFNYNIASGIISQNAAPTDESDGLSIGDFNNGYVLESSLSAAPNNLSLVDSTVNASGGDSGGTLTATPVPFEFEGSAGILTIGAIWGINKWRKNRIKK